MKVILLKDTAKLGKRGEVKDVAETYALHVLIPKGLAIQATQAELTKWKQKEDQAKYKKEIASNTFLQLARTLQADKLIIRGKKADTKGQLFASIKEGDIADSIFETTKLSIDPKQIILVHPIKSIGNHSFIIKQGAQQEKAEVEIIQ